MVILRLKKLGKDFLKRRNELRRGNGLLTNHRRSVSQNDPTFPKLLESQLIATLDNSCGSSCRLDDVACRHCRGTANRTTTRTVFQVAVGPSGGEISTERDGLHNPVVYHGVLGGHDLSRGSSGGSFSQ